ncbi:hypothetical protein C6A77_12395 [Pseudomonas sp. AFG_SD02_1510_Pfu_092]|nr:hypothetical protein C6A77_12395 [Pseudomonas sp. AFG_SD02_1510_Pfu_092]
MDGTGCAGVRVSPGHVGAGSPAKQAARWMAPASPVFAAAAAPTDYRVSPGHVGAGSPAKQTARCMAPAAPVFAAKAAPTGTV